MTGENKSPSALVYSSQSPHQSLAVPDYVATSSPSSSPVRKRVRGWVLARGPHSSVPTPFWRDTGCQDGGLPAASSRRPSWHVMVNAGCPKTKASSNLSLKSFDSPLSD